MVGSVEDMSEGVTLVKVFGEFKEFKGAMTSQMLGFERELREGLGGIKTAVAESDGSTDQLADRLAAVESRQAFMYKILSVVGGVAVLLLAEAARRVIFGA